MTWNDNVCDAITLSLGTIHHMLPHQQHPKSHPTPPSLVTEMSVTIGDYTSIAPRHGTVPLLHLKPLPHRLKTLSKKYPTKANTRPHWLHNLPTCDERHSKPQHKHNHNHKQRPREIKPEYLVASREWERVCVWERQREREREWEIER